MLREERQRLNSWPDTPMRKDQYLLLDERHDSNAGQHLLATQPLPRDPIRERFGAICPRLTQMAHEQRHIGPEKHGVRGGLQGLRKSSDTQDAELTDPQASSFSWCFQETSPGPLPHILTRSLAPLVPTAPPGTQHFAPRPHQSAIHPVHQLLLPGYHGQVNVKPGRPW